MGQKKKKAGTAQPGRKVIARNKRAFRDYTVSDRIEAGMVLQGSEVKSLRDGRINFADSYAEISGGEVFLVACNIAEYPQANILNHEPTRTRKLLLHREEIRRLTIKVAERGFTLVPLEIYFKHGRAKVELGLAKGKRLYDKRDAAREREQSREREAEMRGRR